MLRGVVPVPIAHSSRLEAVRSDSFTRLERVRLFLALYWRRTAVAKPFPERGQGGAMAVREFEGIATTARIQQTSLYHG